MNRRSLLISAASVFLALSTGASFAQEVFPNKPVTIIVSSAPGGAVDLLARLLSEKMSENLKQPVIIQNISGGSTVLGLRAVLEAKPDGYTIGAVSGSFSMLPFAIKDLPFDTLKDFSGIGIMSRQTNVFSIGGKQPYKTMQELVEAAKANPGDMTYAHSGPSSPQFSTSEALNSATGIKIEGVQYQGAGASMIDVVAGRVTMISSGYPGQASFFPDGQLRPLAVSSPERIAPLPDVPTLKELGIDVVSQVWTALLTSKSVPQDRIERLSEALKYAVEDEKVKQTLEGQGSNQIFVTPAEFDQILQEDHDANKALAAKLGLEPQ